MKKAISEMNQMDLIKLACEIEGGESGRSFEESAKYWRDNGAVGIAKQFTEMAIRWHELDV